MSYVAVADRDLLPTSWEIPAIHRSEDRWGVSLPTRFVAALRPRPVAEIQPNEPLELSEPEPIDLAVFPGKVASSMVREAQKTRSVLCKLLDRFYEEGFGWETDDSPTINAVSRDAAICLINLLPDSCSFPQIAPNGEGAVILRFGNEGRDDLVIVDGWTIHIVANAARAGVQYHDNLPFSGSALPSQVLELLVAQ